MRTIAVTASKRYNVIVGREILNDAGTIIAKSAGGQVAAIVTDDNIAMLYAERLNVALANSGYRVVQYVIPHGEHNKNANTFLSLLNFFAEHRLSHKDVVVALGGGVVGDVAGFAAACYMRGIRFVQIPTTLLAMVDSSVGGKTAINLDRGKNLAGTFYQPDAVICDVSLLSTLSDAVFHDGCAEVIKYGIIADTDLFESLKKPLNTQLEDVIARCITIKRDIVVEDEFDNGVRKLLNFGHVVGHAVELLSEYRTSHGKAIAAGMAIVTRAAARMGICEPHTLYDLLHMLHEYKLPVNTTYKADELVDACLSDKKRDGEYFHLAVPERIGKCVIKKISIDEFERFICLGQEEG